MLLTKCQCPIPVESQLFVGVLLFHIWSILLSKPDIHHSNCSWLKLILVLNIGLWLTLVMVSVSKDAYCWWINSWTANMVNQHWPLMKPHSQPSSGNDGRPNKQDDQQHLLIDKGCTNLMGCLNCVGCVSCMHCVKYGVSLVWMSCFDLHELRQVALMLCGRSGLSENSKCGVSYMSCVEQCLVVWVALSCVNCVKVALSCVDFHSCVTSSKLQWAGNTRAIILLLYRWSEWNSILFGAAQKWPMVK